MAPYVTLERMSWFSKRDNTNNATPRLPWWRRWFGTRSERAASSFLRKLGYRILGRNVSCTLGELDLIARDGQTIVFVEVRSTEADDPAAPAYSVDRAKQDRLTRMALWFLQKHRLLNHAARFDVLLITWPPAAPQPTIHHLKNAFEATGRFQMHS